MVVCGSTEPSNSPPPQNGNCSPGGHAQSVYHYLCEQDGTVAAALSCFLPDPEMASGLLALGAVYRNQRRVMDSCMNVEAGDVLRVHTAPRRYSAANIDWGPRIIHETGDFVVVNKPANVPAHPTLDNAVENVQVAVERHLRCRLWVTHRLDQPTHGLMVLAKSAAWAARFHHALAERQIYKGYQAWVEKSVPLGFHQHFMIAEARSPKKILDQQMPDIKTYLCVLEVCSSEAVRSGLYGLKIRLHTGRTHQIRAQLAHLGSPILGDAAYGSPVFFPHGIALICSELRFADQTFTIPVEQFYA